MCWLCEHPGSTRLDYLAHMRRLAEDYGWAVQGVEQDGIRPPWAYTVGLTVHDRPELVVTGLPAEHAAVLLNQVARYVMDTAIPAPGDTVGVTGEPLMEVVAVADPAVHLVTCAEIYGDGIRALQLVRADDHGHWPWCPCYQGSVDGQPVLGARALAGCGVGE